MRSRYRLAVVAVAGVLVLAACGDSDGDADAPSTTEPSAATTSAPSETTAAGEQPAFDGVHVATTSLGDVLVDGRGFTLYGFTDDAAGVPTCERDCVVNWPIVSGDVAVSPDLDAAVFSVVEHPAGFPQLKAGDWPLYSFILDTAPGDVSGQGVGGVWFAVAPDGTLIQG